MSLATAHPLQILVVDDQASIRAVLALNLERAGHQVLQAASGEEAVWLFQHRRPDVVLLDVEMPLHDGYWTAEALRAAEPGGWTPIIFLSSRHDDADVCRGIEAGGDDYLSKPVSPLILNAKLRAMQRLTQMRERLVRMSEELRAFNAQLQHLSERDDLTGLVNRRTLDLRLHQAIGQARRDQQPLTVAMCDVDHFKRFNDALGHLEGDACLKRVAAVLATTCRRPSDCAGRFGGEEFALILPNTPRSGAMTFARALARTLSAAQINHPDSPVAAHVTLSGGITTCVPDDSTTAEGLLLRADDALYTAKHGGRNRFFSYEMRMDTLDKAAGAR
jgi:diguanylate cyclase (GGDEF)-like protein